MNENMVVANDDGEVVFKIKRSAIAEALRSDFEMPVPVTDANIEVVVNQITALIDEFPTGVPTEFFDLGIDHHKGIDFYRKVYGLLDGPCCGTAWASEDSSLVYFAVTDEAGGLTVFHVPSAALAQIDRPFKADTRDLAALRGLSDAELASEIEKAGAAMTERVDAHMSHVHGLGGTEADSAAYYAARKWHADLQFESARRLHASTDRGQRESGRDPQAMANAAAKAAKGRDGDAAGHDGIKH